MSTKDMTAGIRWAAGGILLIATLVGGAIASGEPMVASLAALALPFDIVLLLGGPVWAFANNSAVPINRWIDGHLLLVAVLSVIGFGLWLLLLMVLGLTVGLEQLNN